jgi:hypothetical protein
MLPMRTGLLAAVLAFVAVVPARADVWIRSSPGGEVRRYLMMFEELRQSGERVVIDGPCLSACTLVLSTIPRDRICMTRRAILGFHAARLIDGRGREFLAPEATRMLEATYPTPVRSWIARHGGLTRRLITLRGQELNSMYPVCSGSSPRTL